MEERCGTVKEQIKDSLWETALRVLQVEEKGISLTRREVVVRSEKTQDLL